MTRPDPREPEPDPAGPASSSPDPSSDSDRVVSSAEPSATPESREIGGPKGLEPTRYGDWERNGRCIDF